MEKVCIQMMIPCKQQVELIQFFFGLHFLALAQRISTPRHILTLNVYSVIFADGFGTSL